MEAFFFIWFVIFFYSISEEFIYSIAIIGALVVKVWKIHSISRLVSAIMFLSIVSMALDYFLDNVSYIMNIE